MQQFSIEEMFCHFHNSAKNDLGLISQARALTVLSISLSNLAAERAGNDTDSKPER